MKSFFGTFISVIEYGDVVGAQVPSTSKGKKNPSLRLMKYKVFVEETIIEEKADEVNK